MSATVRVTKLEQENAQLSADLARLRAEHNAVKQQLDWLKRQLFGSKSEKRLDIDPAIQGNLLGALGVANPPPIETPTETVSYPRRKKQRDGAVNDTGLRFGEDVPREIIAVTDPEIEAIPAERRERIGEKVTYRLAQRPGSYVILEYTCPVYKLLDDLTILPTPRAPSRLPCTARSTSRRFSDFEPNSWRLSQSSCCVTAARSAFSWAFSRSSSVTRTVADKVIYLTEFTADILL